MHRRKQRQALHLPDGSWRCSDRLRMLHNRDLRPEISISRPFRTDRRKVLIPWELGTDEKISADVWSKGVCCISHNRPSRVLQAVRIDQYRKATSSCPLQLYLSRASEFCVDGWMDLRNQVLNQCVAGGTCTLSAYAWSTCMNRYKRIMLQYCSTA